MKIFSKNTWGVDVNNAWPLTCKASCLKKIELRLLISGFDFALLEVRNLCVASRLIQSLKLVSYITVERKILQIDEGGASKLKSGKLRNIMIVSLLNIHVPKF